jgi:dipeptidyl aminopeptidase/acylaminoacyl peptidase
MPQWSPAGTRLLFRRGSGIGTSNIIIINRDGTNETNLTNNQVENSDPRWSRDGSRIVFVQASQVCVINADGSGFLALTQGAWPDWSYDGGRIAFLKSVSGVLNLYVMNSDGSGQTRLTNDSFNKWLARWQPISSGPSLPPSIQLSLEQSEISAQAVALDALLQVRDPFPVVNANALDTGADRNTRVVVFVTNLQLLPGETASSVGIRLFDANGQTHDLVAEDVRVTNSGFTQITFRLPNGLALGACRVTLKAHGQTSNTGVIRIKS